MNIFDEKRTELERHEFMMGVERGRLAVALDLLTDSLAMVMPTMSAKLAIILISAFVSSLGPGTCQ